ncbi:SDR family oxidoreductase [Roseivirga sp.]|uniref:SDR family oxidoreductase n=1 Tax=Roseivirga sp. TaxID=1964215 RepID=UPI003B51E078
MKQNRVILAGSTGYLGKHLIKELQLHRIPFIAIARSKAKLKGFSLLDDQIIEAEVTQPATLKNIIGKSDIVISTIGITRQEDGLTYHEVDYQANLNLLQEAKEAEASKFMYVSVLNGENMRHLKIIAAKEAFVDELKTSGINYCIIRPNGFFSDMKDFLNMASKGRVHLFGNGEFLFNPIHGADLAQVIIDQLNTPETAIEVGGPEILTQNELAKLAFTALDKPVKITHWPDWTRKALIRFLRSFFTVKTYGPYEFFLSMMSQDNIAPRYGVMRLKDFFREESDRIQ